MFSIRYLFVNIKKCLLHHHQLVQDMLNSTNYHTTHILQFFYGKQAQRTMQQLKSFVFALICDNLQRYR